MANLLRMSIIGQMPTGEEWSVNPCYIISDFGISTSPAQVQAAATAAAAVAVPTQLLAVMSTGTTVNRIRLEARTASGTLENLAEAVRASSAAGTGATQHPFQTAIVASLRTAQVGATGRGRLYFPATGIALTGATLRPATASVTGFLAGAQTYLSGLQTALRTVFSTAGLIVWSRSTTGMYLVDTIQAGDVLDTQRRRRDALVEAYSAVSYP